MLTITGLYGRRRTAEIVAGMGMEYFAQHAGNVHRRVPDWSPFEETTGAGRYSGPCEIMLCRPRDPARVMLAGDDRRLGANAIVLDRDDRTDCFQLGRSEAKSGSGQSDPRRVCETQLGAGGLG